MAVISFIGAGRIPTRISRLALPQGFTVVLSNTRGPATLTELVSELGESAHAATTEEAAAIGDIVVVSIPFKNFRDVNPELLVGKTVIDTTNYYLERDGHFPRIDDGSTSSSELLQEHLATAHVIKAFNNIRYEHVTALARPRGDSERSVLPIAGNDPAAKTTVANFVSIIGFDVYDVGPLVEGRRFQSDSNAYVEMYGGTRDPEIAGTPHQVTREQLMSHL